MKLLNIVVATLFFLLGAMVPAIAQDQHKDEATPAPHQEEAKPAPHPEAAAPAPHKEGKPHEAPPAARQQEVKPAPHPEQARPVPQHQEAKPAPSTSRQAEPAHQKQGNRPQPTPEQRQVQRTTWQSHRAQHWETEHRSWRQRGGYHGYRIPQARYQEYFGPSHAFAIYTVPVVVYGGYPRFQFGGFWFSVVDPWPEYWADDWFDTDDVYILYTDDGYYLVDQRYPGVLLAVDVAM